MHCNLRMKAEDMTQKLCLTQFLRVTCPQVQHQYESISVGSSAPVPQYTISSNGPS